MNKARFVTRLGILLEGVDRLDIDHLVYKAENDEEYVDIKYKNGYAKRICITGDSELAIIQDVIRHLD